MEDIEKYNNSLALSINKIWMGSLESVTTEGYEIVSLIHYKVGLFLNIVQ